MINDKTHNFKLMNIRLIDFSQTKMSQYMNGNCRLKGWREVDVMLENWAKRRREQRNKGEDSTGSKQESVNFHMSAKNSITTPYISCEVEQFDITLADANYWGGVEGWSCLNTLPLPEDFIESEYCDQYGIFM